ncbi:MAG TPA: hypothetical protein VEH05_02455 [Streptosporangiaceae bacterium]|nr:hypothetical protein [Streptosporangiaceae bacterium]
METSGTDFAAWGLAADWPSSRWIEPIRGPRDRPSRGVRLCHASDSAMVLTCTYPRAQVDDEARTWGFDPVREMAFETTYTQANLALHQISSPPERPDGLVGSLVSHACQRADGYRDWPAARWGEHEAKTTRLASWHSGFSVAYPDAYVIVHACGAGLDDIELVLVDDLSGYQLSRDPAQLGAMHWELWPARPDFGCEELAAMLTTA